MSLARLRSYIAQSSCHFKTIQLVTGPQICTRHPLRSAVNYTTAAHILSPRQFNAWHTRTQSKFLWFISHSRSFATETQNNDPETTRSSAVLVISPDASSTEDLELLSSDEARLELTERAAEKLTSVSTNENDLALRISVESGGCHGYQYKMELTAEYASDDYKFVHPKYRNASVVVDAVSLGLLKGSTVDYVTELIGSSFRILDNPQAKGSGCGCGISWEANF